MVCQQNDEEIMTTLRTTFLLAALPLLLGAKTLARMQAASWDDKLRGIKISRLDVAMILAEAAIACRSADGIARLFTKLSG